MQDLDLIHRILASFFSGAILSMTGSLIQFKTRNEIAGPSTLGFEAVVVLVILMCHFLRLFFNVDLNLETMSLLTLVVFVLLTFLFYQKKDRAKMEKNIIVLGLSINLFIGAIFSFVQFLFLTKNLEFPSQIWFGNFRYVNTFGVISTILVFLLGFFYFYFNRWPLKLLVFGNELQNNLKVKSKYFDLTLVLWSFLAIGVVTIFFGVFSFSSLLFPLILRQFDFFKKNIFNEIFLGSFLSGAILLGLDFMCLNFLFDNAEIPVGMFSSILGSLILIYFLIAKKQEQY